MMVMMVVVVVVLAMVVVVVMTVVVVVVAGGCSGDGDDVGGDVGVCILFLCMDAHVQGTRAHAPGGPRLMFRTNLLHLIPRCRVSQ